jgi:hypothetical protein
MTYSHVRFLQDTDRLGGGPNLAVIDLAPRYASAIHVATQSFDS